MRRPRDKDGNQLQLNDFVVLLELPFWPYFDLDAGTSQEDVDYHKSFLFGPALVCHQSAADTIPLWWDANANLIHIRARTLWKACLSERTFALSPEMLRYIPASRDLLAIFSALDLERYDDSGKGCLALTTETKALKLITEAMAEYRTFGS